VIREERFGLDTPVEARARHLVEKGIDMITEPTGGGSSPRGSIGEVFQANRVPLALIGAGIAWLLASNTGLVDRVAQDQRLQAARRRIGEIAGEVGIGGDAKGEGATGRSAQILGPDGEPAIRAGDTSRTEGWVHQAAGAARGAISSVRVAGGAVLDRAGKYTDYAGDAGDLAKRAGGQLASKLERDPWLTGVAGMVAGAVLAAVLPPTAIEQACIGEAREGLMNKAAEIGHEATDRVRELAETTTRASIHRASGV
jgi:hypothetical protein